MMILFKIIATYTKLSISQHKSFSKITPSLAGLWHWRFKICLFFFFYNIATTKCMAFICLFLSLKTVLKIAYYSLIAYSSKICENKNVCGQSSDQQSEAVITRRRTFSYFQLEKMHPDIWTNTCLSETAKLRLTSRLHHAQIHKHQSPFCHTAPGNPSRAVRNPLCMLPMMSYPFSSKW